eukprot:TRINITY_DN1941_c0_g2_i1.p1 TRINITY_DN1941_c0_g2~~TRINITY_DN1941_c0_g2_i1.p1  ORF type:complete len:728 (+),score=108.42 TRINITY_DN1941_c0_g2_i1:236-2419(+)
MTGGRLFAALACFCAARAGDAGSPENFDGWTLFTGFVLPSGSDVDPTNPHGKPLSVPAAIRECRSNSECQGFTFMKDGQPEVRHKVGAGQFWVYLKTSPRMAAMEGWVTYVRVPMPSESISSRRDVPGQQCQQTSVKHIIQEPTPDTHPPPVQDAINLFQEASAALERIDDGIDPIAFQQLADSAALGHAEAHFLLGVFHSIGLGVEANEALAVTHLTFAAHSGSADAALALGTRHTHGHGVEQMCALSLPYLRMTADAVAHDHIHKGIHRMPRVAYLHDPTVSRTRDRQSDLVAAHQYKADRGYTQSQMRLGQAYMWGRGAPQDGFMALRYFWRAADLNVGPAYGHIGQIFANGIYTGANVVPKNYTAAVEAFAKGVSMEDQDSMNGLGYMHLKGLGVPQDNDKAVQLFSRAVAAGSKDGMYNLGLLCLTGVLKDSSKGVRLLADAAKLGNILASWQLGVLHQEGTLVNQDCVVSAAYFSSVSDRGSWAHRLERAYSDYVDGNYARALLWYLVAAEQGMAAGAMNAGWMIQHGKGIEDLPLTGPNPVYEPKFADARSEDYVRHSLALRYWERSAAAGHGEGMVRLGDACYYGLGLEEDKERAFVYYSRAAERRSHRGMFNVGYMFEHGVGVPQNFKKARESYDQALDASPHAWWPVTLASLKLSLHRAVMEGTESSAAAVAAAWKRDPRRAVYFGLSPEDIGLALLSALLLFLLVIRHHLHFEAPA